MSGLRVRVVAACAALALAACSPEPTGTPPDASDTSPLDAVAVSSVPTVLVLDGSGSMTQADAPGPRIDAAKSAVHGLIDALPEPSVVALETYGTTTGSAEGDKAAGCRDVTTLIPLGPLDRAGMGRAIDGIVPSGYTPLSLALQSAADQLPADATPQAIVLVSDGEDTCDTPACDTAAQLKKSHPALTISTVGFKVDGPAADQLRCIADTTGGLFVQAANSDQLAARLLATQNLDAAAAALGNNGAFGIRLGTTLNDIRTQHPDFPAADRTGAVTVVWRDCDFGFVDGTVDFIRPHNGGRTIDGLAAGAAVARAGQLYGAPLATTRSGNTTSAIFDADPNTDAAYRMEVDSFADTNGNLTGTIISITLCRCKPRPTPTVSTPEQIVLEPVDTQGNTTPGYLKDSRMRDQPIDCSFPAPSPYDVTKGVRFCGSTADSGDACWPTAGNAYVLCLIDPFKPSLTLRAAIGAETALDAPSGPPRPMGIELDDGTQCRARNGGSWPGQAENPDYVGHFSCSGGSTGGRTAIVWAPRNGDHGIAKGPDGWTVQVGGESGPLATHRVVKAYFVGVA